MTEHESYPPSQEASDHSASEARTLSLDAASRDGQRQPILPISSGMSVGRYTTQRVLGEGGMGVVYVARQQSPDRLVALKLVRPGFATARALKRFEDEADVLGRLQHPGIAQIYDAGIIEQGGTPTPFFAMELIDGQSLTAHASARNLSVRARLELLAKVCDAVQHAHQKGVIHRDLKPSNIMVNAAGEPKILDFGIARTVDADAQQQTLQTLAGELVGTVPYMSPEQTVGDPASIDTRSDVYALGVLGHELLAGDMPYGLENTTIHDAMRIIQHTPPRRLGTIDRALRGDVETIIAKALEKEPGRRYQSAGELAADIRRHLHDEPIEARPAGVVYQFSRFAKRNRAIVSASAAVLLTIVLGGVVAGALAVSESRARADLADALTVAERKTDIAEAVNEFLRIDILGQANPETQQNSEMTVREAVDAAAATVGERFADQPEVEAAVRYAIGMVYHSLGQYDDAMTQFTHAREKFIETSGIDSEETVRIEGMIATTLDGLGRLEESDAAFQEVLERYRKVFGPEHIETLQMMHNHAVLLDDLGQSEEALELLKQQLTIFRRVRGEDHEDTLASMSAVAQVHLSLRQYELAEPLLHELLEARRELLGDDHPRTMVIRNNLAIMYMNGMDAYDKALPLLQQVVEDRVRILGEGHVSTLTSMDNLAVLYMNMERYNDALALFHREIEAARASLGENHPDTCWGYYNLARCYEQMGELQLAADWFARSLEGRQESLPASHTHIERSMRKLAAVLTQLADFERLEPAALARHAWLLEHMGADHEATQQAAVAISEMYENWGKPELARTWRQREGEQRP